MKTKLVLTIFTPHKERREELSPRIPSLGKRNLDPLPPLQTSGFHPLRNHVRGFYIEFIKILARHIMAP